MRDRAHVRREVRIGNLSRFGRHSDPFLFRYVPVSAGQAELQRDTADGLKALIEVALEISNLKEFLGREKPTVIT